MHFDTKSDSKVICYSVVAYVKLFNNVAKTGYIEFSVSLTAIFVTVQTKLFKWILIWNT